MAIEQILGWPGMLLILFAYARRTHLPLRLYALINLAGSTLLGIVCFIEATWPVFALQAAWAAVAIVDLVRSMGGATEAE